MASRIPRVISSLDRSSIGVFDAKHKRAVVLSRIEPVEQCSSGATDVEVPGGGRRKANANLGLAHLPSFRSAATASRTTSVFGSSDSARIWSVDDGSPMLPTTLTIPARTFGFMLRM